MTTRWTRLDERKLRNVGGRESCLLLRAYGPGKKTWPRLVIKVYREMIDGLSLSVSVKRNSVSYWENCPIPIELVDEAAAMLGQAVGMLREIGQCE